MRTVAGFFLVLSWLVAEPAPRNRLTFSGGWSREAGGSPYAQKQTATGFGLSFGYRLYRYIEPEVGVFTGLQPSAAVRGRNRQHFWLGATPRWFLANPAYTRDRWFQISAEFSVRF